MARASKYKFGASIGEYNYGASAGKYKFGARAGKYKLGARVGSQRIYRTMRMTIKWLWNKSLNDLQVRDSYSH